MARSTSRRAGESNNCLGENRGSFSVGEAEARFCRVQSGGGLTAGRSSFVAEEVERIYHCAAVSPRFRPKREIGGFLYFLRRFEVSAYF